MLKVLQISNKAPYPANDGSSIAIYNMARGFIENGVELHLLTINTKKHFKPDDGVPPDFRKKSNYRSVFRNTGTSATGALMNLFSKQSYFVSRFYFREFEDLLVRKLREVTFDVVQLEGLFMAVYLEAIRKHSSARIVLRAHNVEYLIWDRHISVMTSGLKKFYLQLQNNRLRKFETEIFHHVDAIVSITDIDKQFIRSIAGEKPVYTCITGVDIAEYRNNSQVKNKNTIFSFASMDWMPNQEAVDWFLKNCWEKVRTAVPGCKLIIAGRNMPLHLRNLRLENTEVIENVPDSKKFYQEQGIMLVPLLSGSGLRIKIIEGMAYGKAIVSTSIGAEGIHAVNGRHILLADSPDEFASAVISLLMDPEKREKLEAEAGKFAAGEFDNKKVVKKLIDFYSSLNV